MEEIHFLRWIVLLVLAASPLLIHILLYGVSLVNVSFAKWSFWEHSWVKLPQFGKYVWSIFMHTRLSVVNSCMCLRNVNQILMVLSFKTQFIWQKSDPIRFAFKSASNDWNFLWQKPHIIRVIIDQSLVLMNQMYHHYLNDSLDFHFIVGCLSVRNGVFTLHMLANYAEI